MAIFDNVIHVIFSLLTVFAVLVGLGLLSYIGDLVKSKTNYYAVKAKTEANRPVSINDRISTTNALLDIIDLIISNEIKGTLKSYIRLNQPYSALKIPEDIERISTNVYKSLKGNIFANDELVVNDEYIYEFICGETTLLFITICQELNVQVKNNE
jgi:hypothetical protein